MTIRWWSSWTVVKWWRRFVVIHNSEKYLKTDLQLNDMYVLSKCLLGLQNLLDKQDLSRGQESSPDSALPIT